VLVKCRDFNDQLVGPMHVVAAVPSRVQVSNTFFGLLSALCDMPMIWYDISRVCQLCLSLR
jgi:hypothetical protein